MPPAGSGRAAMPVVPRLLKRKEAAAYMGRCVKTFDEIRHLFEVNDHGLIRYDRVLMDRYIDLLRAA